MNHCDNMAMCQRPHMGCKPGQCKWHEPSGFTELEDDALPAWPPLKRLAFGVGMVALTVAMAALVWGTVG